ncbi:zinc finger, CCHC-type containing protein [Tanacetum coccineum]
MAGNTVKEMTMNFGKLDTFEGHDFRRWQKKMHFLLTMLKMVYVLTTPITKLLEDARVEAIRIRAKWENDDYICRGHILNGMSDSLFDVYTNVKSAKELWDSLESTVHGVDSSRSVPRTYNEAMQSQDSAFWKEAIDDEIGFIMENNTWVLSDLPPVARITTIRLLLALAAIHNLVIHQMDVKTTFLNGDLDEKEDEAIADGKQAPKAVANQKFDEIEKITSNPGESVGKANNKACSKGSSSTSGWVFLLRGGAISWALKNQTCITGSTIESEFVALAAASKEAEWLRNLIHEIPIWPKPIAPISI